MERKRCIINIREGVLTRDDGIVTSIQIIPDDGWEQEENLNNIVIKRRKKEEGREPDE